MINTVTLPMAISDKMSFFDLFLYQIFQLYLRDIKIGQYPRFHLLKHLSVEDIENFWQRISGLVGELMMPKSDLSLIMDAIKVTDLTSTRSAFLHFNEELLWDVLLQIPMAKIEGGAHTLSGFVSRPSQEITYYHNRSALSGTKTLVNYLIKREGDGYFIATLFPKKEK
jgi:hypothetical protein